MKKSFFLFFALVAGAINLFADECVKTPTTLKGTASVIFTRYEHKNLTGAFAVSNSGDDTTYVAFSQGNLQYQQSTKTWRFAEHQWDSWMNVAAAGNFSSETARQKQAAWIDLFGYGTSGAETVNGGSAVCYQPWSYSKEASDYSPGGSDIGNLSGNWAEADWAYHNAIINGGLDANGGVEHAWRILSNAEWVYLFNTRNNAATLYGLGTLMGVNGLFILPDAWSWSKAEVAEAVTAYGFSFVEASTSYTNNVIDDSTEGVALWDAMEAAGAVFLPAEGRRNGVAKNAQGTGHYWSSTHVSTDKARELSFKESEVNASSIVARYFGCSVRAVRVLATE